MESILAITRALSDENRVRALLALGDQEVCVCQLIELLQLAPSTVSKHMSILKQAGLVAGQKKGRWMYYRLPGPAASPAIRQALSWVRQAVSKASRIQEDSERMEKILKTNRDRLCERQAARRRLGGGGTPHRELHRRFTQNMPLPSEQPSNQARRNEEIVS